LLPVLWLSDRSSDRSAIPRGINLLLPFFCSDPLECQLLPPIVPNSSIFSMAFQVHFFRVIGEPYFLLFPADSALRLLESGPSPLFRGRIEVGRCFFFVPPDSAANYFFFFFPVVPSQEAEAIWSDATRLSPHPLTNEGLVSLLRSDFPFPPPKRRLPPCSERRQTSAALYPSSLCLRS